MLLYDCDCTININKYLFIYNYFETGTHYLALACLEFNMKVRLTLNS